MKKKLNYNNFYYYVLLVLPVLVIYITFFIIPVVQSFYYSFTNFNGINPVVKFIGLTNYEVAFTDRVFLGSIKNTVFLAIGITILQNVLAIIMALALNHKFKGRGIVRTLVFAPCMLAPVVVAYLWQFIYSPDGLLNRLIGSENIWLSDSKTALIGIIVAHTWVWIGYSATIYLADLQGISTDILEAAAIDGCNPWQKFKKITFPLIATSTTVNISLAFMGSLKIFDLVYAMTNGGPNGATETMGTYVMKKMNMNMHGYASSLTIIMMVLIIVAGHFLTKYLKNREEVLY